MTNKLPNLDETISIKPKIYSIDNTRCDQRINELLDDQHKQLSMWKIVLKKNIFDKVIDYIDDCNEELMDLMMLGENFHMDSYVMRGSDIQQHIGQILHTNKEYYKSYDDGVLEWGKA